MLPAGSRQPAGARRPLIIWDAVLSGVALSVTGMIVALGVFGAVFLLAFMDYCPQQTCSRSGALVSVGGSVVVAIAAGAAGLAVTVLRIVDRRLSWPFSLATLAVCAMSIGYGTVSYFGAVGY